MRARLALLTTALLFSSGGAAIKACTLSSWQVASLRSFFAAVTLWIAFPSARERWTPPVLLVGASQAATMILFVSATKLTTAANAIFLQATAPLYVLVLAPLLLREPVRRSDGLFLVAFLVGLCTILFGTAPAAATAPNPRLGNWLGAASGISWAFTLIGFRFAAREQAAFGATLLAGNVIVALLCLPPSLPFAGATALDWTIVSTLGVFQLGLAYALLSIGMREVPALEASLLMLLEPTLNPVWAWLVQGERVGAASAVGGAIVMATIAAKSVVDWRLYSAPSLAASRNRT